MQICLSTVLERPLTWASGSLLACQEGQTSLNTFLTIWFDPIQPNGISISIGMAYESSHVRTCNGSVQLAHSREY